MNERLSRRKKINSTLPSNNAEPEKLAQEDVSLQEDPALATITVTAVEVPELTEQEQSDRLHLERIVERSFFEAGKALMELRDRRLYRSTHRTFEQYCKDRFGLSRDTAYLKLSATVVYDNIEKFLPTNGRQIPMPTNERQLRDLAKADFEPHVQADVLQRAVEQANGKVPSGRIVKSIVEQLKDKPLFSARDFCQIGDVFTICKLEGTERKYNNCWALAKPAVGIAVALNDFTVEVDVHDATLTVKPENLNKIDSPEAHRQLPQIKKRILRLRECGNLDRCAYTVLESLGKQIYLTAVEDGLLQWLEKHYGVIR